MIIYKWLLRHHFHWYNNYSCCGDWKCAKSRYCIYHNNFQIIKPNFQITTLYIGCCFITLLFPPIDILVNTDPFAWVKWWLTIQRATILPFQCTFCGWRKRKWEKNYETEPSLSRLLQNNDVFSVFMGVKISDAPHYCLCRSDRLQIECLAVRQWMCVPNRILFPKEP